MKDSCDFPAFSGQRIQDNIVLIEVKKIKQMTAADVTQIYDCFKECGGEEGVFVMVTFKGYIPLSDDAMEEAKKQASQNQKTVRATSFVIKSAAFRISIKFFMNFYKPKNKMHICGSKEESLAWLKKEKKLQAEMALA